MKKPSIASSKAQVRGILRQSQVKRIFAFDLHLKVRKWLCESASHVYRFDPGANVNTDEQSSTNSREGEENSMLFASWQSQLSLVKLKRVEI
jgi:hypothetical protein